MSLNVFVSEYLCSGACFQDEVEPSLLAEGTAMLEAVLSDLLTLADVRVQTCVQPGLLTADEFQQAAREQRLQIYVVREKESETDLFQWGCRQADVALIIAPEFDDLLVTRTRWAEAAGTRVIGSDREAIQLASDKWRLFQILSAADIPTIETELLTPELHTPSQFPYLIKQRFGAGGLGLERFTHQADWKQRLPELQRQSSSFVGQPFVKGQALSVAALIEDGRCELFPVGEQCIGWEPEFVYQGGRIPFGRELEVREAIGKLVQQVHDLVPGLAGYVGFDILLPDREPLAPLLVEINPRLTTAYCGYRRLTPDNLAERLLNLNSRLPPLRWNQGQAVKFLPDGSVEITSLSEKEKRCM